VSNACSAKFAQDIWHPVNGRTEFATEGLRRTGVWHHQTNENTTGPLALAELGYLLRAVNNRVAHTETVGLVDISGSLTRLGVNDVGGISTGPEYIAHLANRRTIETGAGISEPPENLAIIVCLDSVMGLNGGEICPPLPELPHKARTAEQEVCCGSGQCCIYDEQNV
jgi:hypothetical protein